jgi:outer membrane protein OmpA-like peptidoglycan-associated protein
MWRSATRHSPRAPLAGRLAPAALAPAALALPALAAALALPLALLAGCGGEKTAAPPSGPAPGAAAPAAPPAGASGAAAVTADPEPADAQARAVAALAGARVLDLAPQPPQAIDGMGGATGEEVKPIAGMASSIEATAAKDLASAMADLHARTVGREIHIELSADVLFDFDKADIRPDAAAALAKAAVVIRAHPGARVRVEGHTDGKGTHAYNLKLSERRAQSVATWLKQREGLGATAFQAQGFGETRPVAPNAKPDGSDDPAGRQQNRRVEIVVSPAE